MEYPWRPRPPTGNFCPVCSNSHFPVCPPLPPQFFRPPPPPPPDQFYHTPQPPLPPPPPAMPPPPLPPQPSYDPFVDHQGGPSVNPYAPPPPARTPPPPWNGGPNYGNDYYGGANNSAQIGAKRMRVDSFADDERRLKLIRDHGAPVHGLDRSYDGGFRLPNDSLEASNYGDVRGNHWDRQMNQNYGEGRIPYHELSSNQNQSNLAQNHGHSVHEADQYRKLERPHLNREALTYGNATYQEQRRNFSKESWEFNNQLSQHHIMEPKSTYYGLPNRGENLCQPPLPASPSPPLPAGPRRFQFSESVVPPSTSGPSSLFPVARDSSSTFQSQYTVVSEPIKPVFSQNSSISSGYYPEDIQAGKTTSSKSFKGGNQEFSPSHLSLDKPTVIDASHIFKHPHRANRPDHIVVILRGLPGSGKSYFAKMLRDLEVENGGTAPRIHSIDEYFMTEVEKIEENEGSKSSVPARGRKPVMKKVMEYCYEPEMEEAYRSSMLKSFKKTLDEGTFPFVIVDDRNLRVADFAQFWATAKRSGYEVYLLEATYKDPAGCAARNVHGFTQNDIQNMANQWEEAPTLYMKLDVKSLVHGDELEENGIQEVDMDTEDGNDIGDPTGPEDTNIQKVIRPDGDITSDGPSKVEQERDATEEHASEVVKELGKSKWSNDLDEDEDSRTKATRGNATALSSLIKSYSKQGKSVRWADQIGRVGFSIGVGRSTNVSLVIGPGAGYNLKSNPLPEEEKLTQRSGESRRRSTFQEQLRAERESFKAVFDKRRYRISVLDGDDD